MLQGEKVVVFDIDSASMELLESQGAMTASSPTEVATSSDRIVTMLPDNAIVKGVFDEMLKVVRPGTLLIDSSTVDPAVSKEIARKCAEKEADFVDAPVSGGENIESRGLECLQRRLSV